MTSVRQLASMYASGMPLRAISAATGMATRSISGLLRGYGVVLRGGRRAEVDPDAVVKAYAAGGSLNALASQFGVGHKRIKATLEAANVAVRPPGGKSRVFEVSNCAACPFGEDDLYENRFCAFVRAAKLPPEGPPPDWCPLRKVKKITVRLQKPLAD